MIFAAAQIWLTDHLTAKSLCDASKILERSKSFSLINHFSAPAVYNFSTEKRSVYCKLSRLLQWRKRYVKLTSNPCTAEKRPKKKKGNTKRNKKITAPRCNAFKSRVVPPSPIVSPQ